MDVDLNRYVFRSVWRLPAERSDVYAALLDVAAYPNWWPQVRVARQLDDSSGELVCRSALPYDLRFVAHREVEDPANQVLRARLAGDLDGWTQWTVVGAPDAADVTFAVFDEDVVVRRRVLRAAGRLARPALRHNHSLMMRAGERGLQRRLIGALDRFPEGAAGA
jgi:hypothetical protein